MNGSLSASAAPISLRGRNYADHRRKCGLKRFLVMRNVAGAEVGWPILG
jgi:hypothetical protein